MTPSLNHPKMWALRAAFIDALAREAYDMQSHEEYVDNAAKRLVAALGEDEPKGVAECVPE